MRVRELESSSMGSWKRRNRALIWAKAEAAKVTESTDHLFPRAVSHVTKQLLDVALQSILGPYM